VSVEEQLDRLLAESDIRKVLYTYCHAIDRTDLEELKTVYHPTAIDNHGVFSGAASDYASWVIDALAGATETQHLIGNVNVDVDGDVAHVESYLQGTSLIPTEDGGTRVEVLIGRYVDRFERRNGSWKIAHRTFVRDFDYTLPAVSETRAGVYQPGSRSRQDLSYQRARR